MKELYIALMEKALGAYSDEHIKRYFDEVKENGLKEHGFPRLTADIGILIANGKRRDLLPLFCEMMELCCHEIPRVKAANDFSVREIVVCLEALEAARAVPEESMKRWRAALATIDPTVTYTCYARAETDKVKNWALFTAVSEYARLRAGLGGSLEFIELQLATQLRWLDENGMYMDKAGTRIHQPMVYDLVPRGLFALLLSFGYRGRYYEAINEALRKSALLTLDMQSSNGEIPYGGRSNQFLHNEAWLAVIYEYEAVRYAREGNTALSARFKAATAAAVAVTEDWLAMAPIRHVKNRYPTETGYGCEDYAYFDKYMITVASIYYMAYLLCDDSITATESTVDSAPVAVETSWHFHKLFLRAGEYAVEIDTNADADYDASGLGRLHRRGAPAAICLSSPCPSHADYKLDVRFPDPLSLCPALRVEGEWLLGAEEGVLHEVLKKGATDTAATATLAHRFPNGERLQSRYTVSDGGVLISLGGQGELALALPAFVFDGECTPAVTVGTDTLTVAYRGYLCRYRVRGGSILPTERLSANRNGHYRTYLAVGENAVEVFVDIVSENPEKSQAPS